LFASIDSGVGDGASDLGKEALRCAEEGNNISRPEFDICLRGLCGKAGEDLAHIHLAPSGTELDDCLGTIPNAPEPHAHSMRSLTFPTMATHPPRRAASFGLVHKRALRALFADTYILSFSSWIFLNRQVLMKPGLLDRGRKTNKACASTNMP